MRSSSCRSRHILCAQPLSLARCCDSRGGAYHNKKFKEAAEARDLKISYDPRVGWSITEPTDALCEFILEQDWQDISMNRIEDFYAPRGKGAGDATGKPTGSN